MIEPATLLHADEDYACATWRRVFIVLWRRDTPVLAVQDVARRQRSFGSALPEGCGMITVIDVEARPLGAEASRELATFLRNASHVKASGVAYEGTGFRASVARTVVTSLTVLARQPFPHQVFSTVPDACRWLMLELAKSVGAGGFASEEELSEAIAQLRARLG